MTNPALSGEPGPGDTCRVCGSRLPDGSLHCAHCGATYGESNRCPHCKSVADVEPSNLLRYRCRVCGGPRVAVDDASVVRTGREAQVLARAARLYKESAAFRVGAGVLLGFGVLSLLVALGVIAIAAPGAIGVAGMAFMAAVPLVIAALAFRRSQSARRGLNEQLDQAFCLVAADVLAARGGAITASELGRVLRLEEPRAEALLGQLNVNDFIHARVTDDGDIVYESEAPARLRVTELSDELPPGVENASEVPAKAEASPTRRL